jgi:hypothetical protein
MAAPLHTFKKKRSVSEERRFGVASRMIADRESFPDGATPDFNSDVPRKGVHMEASSSRSRINTLALLLLCAALPFCQGCKTDLHSPDGDTTETHETQTSASSTEAQNEVHPSKPTKPLDKNIVKKIRKSVPVPKGTVGVSGSVVLGDVNGDGKVTEADPKVAIALSSGKKKPTPRQLVAIDFNHDGAVNVSEVTALQKAVKAHAKGSH